MSITSLLCAAQNESIEELYKLLDADISNSSSFIEKRETHINTLKKSINIESTPEKRYTLYFKIFEEYKAFINDSAIVYIMKCKEEARLMGNLHYAADCDALMAFQFSAVGAYQEALAILESINKQDLDRKGLGDYYVAYNHVYGEIGSYGHSQAMKQFFYKKADKYRDSLLSILEPNSEIWLMKKESYLVTNEKRYDEALKLNDMRLAMCKEGTHEYGIVAYYRSQIYKELKDTENTKYWLLKSAICDVENAVMDQASLWMLADIVSSEGNVDRAYDYINFSWDAAKRFGTRVRNWQISPIFGTIEHNYQMEIKKTNRHLIILIIVISVMVVLLMGLLYYVNRQRFYVTSARNQLKKTNSQLESLNKQLSSANENLDVANQQLGNANSELRNMNSKLNESNRMKEEYIGHFFGLCTNYINKTDEYRQHVSKKVKNKQFNELLDMTWKPEMKEQELEELYSNFDSVFLHLFPNFVNDLNSLLKVENQIHLSDPNKFTTTIRVFALIRLGIDDSTKIADFLHYAVNTIYNYRAQLRNGAIGDRSDFERKVKTLGTIVDN